MSSQEKPRLIIVADPNGTGKTSITEQLLMHQWMSGCVYINPDMIVRDEFGDWNCRDNVLKAAQRAYELRATCLRDRVSLAFETVLSTGNKIDFIQQAIQAGFFARLFFIGTDDPSINAKRVASRVMAGGQDVPISKITATLIVLHGSPPESCTCTGTGTKTDQRIPQCRGSVNIRRVSREKATGPLVRRPLPVRRETDKISCLARHKGKRSCGFFYPEQRSRTLRSDVTLRRIAMTTETIQAGSSVESACRKCKTVTDHHVVVMIDEKIGKVQCKVCGGKHAHRPPKAAPAPKAAAQPKAPAEKKPRASAAKKPAAPKKPSPEVLALWESKVASTAPGDVKPYAMAADFEDGDVISHSVFGPGFVQRFIKPNMIEVLFEDGLKMLRCCAEAPGSS